MKRKRRNKRKVRTRILAPVCACVHLHVCLHYRSLIVSNSNCRSNEIYLQDTKKQPLVKLPSEPNDALLQQAEQAAADLANSKNTKENDAADILEVCRYVSVDLLALMPCDYMFFCAAYLCIYANMYIVKFARPKRE